MISVPGDGLGQVPARLRPNEDVDHMNDLGMDLNDYSAVKNNADLILSRLKDTDSPMPPRPRGPWSPEWIQCFEQWIKSGKLP